MRICLASIHPRALSGQIESLVGLAQELEQIGHEVAVISAFGSEILDGNRLALAGRDSGLLWGKLTRIGGILANVVRQARRADLVHLNLPTPAFGILGDLVQRLVAVPVVVGFEAHLAETRRLLDHGYLWQAPRFFLPRLLVNNGAIARSTWHRADRYIVSSQHQATELHRLGFPEGRVTVLPNVVDTRKLERIDRHEARRRLGLPDGELIGYIGHYHPVKGVEDLVRAFATVVRERPRARLVLGWSGLGDPRTVEREIDRLGIGERIVRLGRVPIGQILSALDVIALPYRLTMGQHAFPGLVIEAMAVGVPLVTTDLPLLREIVTPGRTGLIAPPGDAPALAASIARLLGDGALAAAIVAAQRSWFARSLHPKEVARQYVRVYRQARAGEAMVLRPTEG